MINDPNEVVTIFGGGGFIGRYVCERLLDAGVRLMIASRNPRSAYFLQPLAQVGQYGFARVDVSSGVGVAEAVAGAAAVVNVSGLLNRPFSAFDPSAAGNVARAARDCGAKSLVHVSAIGADPNSSSRYGRRKGEAEAAVRDIFPEATIVRPSLVFGPEDDLTNRFAAMARLPFVPIIAARRASQPVYVVDLAKAVAKAALHPSVYGGKTYEVGGPQVMSMKDLHETILEITEQTPELVHAPDIFGRLLSRLGWLPGAPLTRDQWVMFQRDNIPTGELPGLEAFGIEPTPLASVGYGWLGRFRKGGKFAGRRINLTATT